MKILLLGGTLEAKKIAKALIALKNELDLEIIYSIAGLVRKPELDCEIILGGFSRFTNANNRKGLTEYLLAEKIDYLLDATHPFASKMTQQAIQSAQNVGIPYGAFVRAEWTEQEGDHWCLLEDEHQLLNELALAVNTGSKNIFYTLGQINKTLMLELEAIAELNEVFGSARYIIRTAKETELPQYAHWIHAIGPFSIAEEKALLVKYNVDLIVSKNSGGDGTKAKLDAARELGIRVLMLQRPNRKPNIGQVCNTLDECLENIKRAKYKYKI